MKRVLLVLGIALFVGMPSLSVAVDFSTLLGTWEGVSQTTLLGEPFEVDFIWTITEASDNFAIGHRGHTIDSSEESFVVHWDASRGQFKLEDIGVYFFNVVGNRMTGTVEFFEGGTINATKNTDCLFESIDVTGFNLNTSVLTLPTVCIGGTTYRLNLQIKLNADGTWEIVQ